MLESALLNYLGKRSYMKKLVCLTLSIIVLGFSVNTHALTFALPEKDNDIVGQVKEVTAEAGDSFAAIGRRYDVGYYELIEANPNVNPDNTPGGTTIVIPSRFILPNAPRKGIVINLAELRLYYFPPDKNQVWTYPIGIGRQGWLTPTCNTTIIAKKEKPTWIVPKSVKEDRAAHGVDLPDKVLPGPDNPLGDYAMRLGLATYLVHGTNEPSGVGRRSSAGCIRMFPEDVEELFKSVKIGTPVHIVNDAYKVGWYYRKLYLEAHLPLQEQREGFDNDLTPVVEAILTATHENKDVVNWDAVNEVATFESGIPHCISRSAEAAPQEETADEKEDRENKELYAEVGSEENKN